MSYETQVETVRQGVTDALSIIGEVMSEICPLYLSLEGLTGEPSAQKFAVFLPGAS
jgi:hypothetical protein